MRKISFLLIIMLLCVWVCGCSLRGDGSDEEVPELLPAAGVASDVFTVFRGDCYVPKVYDASVIAYVEELSLTQNAYVDEVLVTPGQDVKAGDLLISIDLDSEREQAAALEESIAYTKQINALDNQIAELNIEMLEIELAQLTASGADAQTLELKALDIEAARQSLEHTRQLQQMSLEDSEAQLEKLYATIANDGIYAPFDGRVSNVVELKHGSRITAYDPVIYLADNTRLTISVEYISDSAYAQAGGGVYALINDARYEVERVPIDYNDYLSVVLAGGTVYCEFNIVGEHTAEAGDYCALVFLNNYSADQLLIPANAFLTDADSKYVYVVGENGARERRDVKVKYVSGAIYAMVTEGLEEGEQIYVTDK